MTIPTATETTQPILSMCMIVRDNERTIRACLESIRPWVDQMVVVDTGSTDRTPDIARELGAEVHHFPWCDDFAAARNESLKHARGQWLFWMDSDDTIDEINGQRLRKTPNSHDDPMVLGYVMQVHCPGPANGSDNDLTIVDHVKLFRNRPDLRFDGRIHEQILPSIRAAGGQVVWTDAFVVHSGYDHSPAGQVRKRTRDLRILRLELAERPNHPFTLFNLGMTHTDTGEYAIAAEYLRKSLTVAEPGESHVRKAYALLVYCLRKLARLDEARQVCRTGLQLFPQDAELLFRSGLLLHESGQHAESVIAYQAAMESQEGPHFSSIDPGIRGFKALQNQAIVYADMGRHDLAELNWRAILRKMPRHRQAWRGLGECLVRQSRFLTAECEAAALTRIPDRAIEGRLLAAAVAEAREDSARARAELTEAIQAAQDEAEPLERLCKLEFDHGASEAAAAALEALLAQIPHSASTHHNLGCVRLRQNDPQAAAESFAESLRLRPGYADSLANLAHAWDLCGRTREAEELRRQGQAQQYAPADRATAAVSPRPAVGALAGSH